MHRLIRVSLLALVLVSTGLVCQPLSALQMTGGPALAVEVTTEKLAEGIYVFTAPKEMDWYIQSNTVAVVGDDAVTIFDTNSRPSTANRVIERLRAVTDKPVRLIINSHWHIDHWRGNQSWVEAFPEAEIVSTIRTREVMSLLEHPGPSWGRGQKERIEALAVARETGAFPDGGPASTENIAAAEAVITRREPWVEEMQDVRITLPTMTYESSMVLWVGGRRIELYSVQGDASGSTVMFVPDVGVMAAGDALVRHSDGQGGQPWAQNNYAFSDWLEGLRLMESLDARITVPGLGPALLGNEYLTTQRELFESLIAQTHAAMRRGHADDYEYVRSIIDVEDFRRRYGMVRGGDRSNTWDRVIGLLVKRIMQAARDGRSLPGGE